MGRADAVGVVGEQRLGLCAGRRASSGVPDMADTKITTEHEHVVLLEYLGDEAIVLAQIEVAFFGGDDAGGVWLGQRRGEREGVEQGWGVKTLFCRERLGDGARVFAGVGMALFEDDDIGASQGGERGREER